MDRQPIQFRSNGKLLLTGEYLVLKGAKSLAIPSSFGSELNIICNDRPVKNFRWETYEKEKLVFQGAFDLQGNILTSTNETIGNGLAIALKALLKLAGKDFFAVQQVDMIQSDLEFPMNWGLGSSSTLVSNLSRWAKVDPYRLLEKTFGGSGYDIACATAQKPVLYQLQYGKPFSSEEDFYPPFHDQIHFVYLNKKKNSRDALMSFSKVESKVTDKLLERITVISESMLTISDVREFSSLLEEHESLIAEMLGVEPIGKSRFADFPGTIKSLGAWGGDFVMAVGEPEQADYFRTRGYNTVIPFDQMIKQQISTN